MAALARIDELRKRYDENPRRFFAPLANEYRKSGDLEQAIGLCRAHLADAPNNISGQIVFGQALFDAGTLDESRTAFETAIGLDHENLIALRHLGDIAKAQLDVPKAREWYQRVLDADRRNEEVLALMEELKTLDIAVPDAPAAEVAGDTMIEMGAPVEAPAVAVARSPISSSASLTGTDTPTLQMEAMVPAQPAEPQPPAAPEELSHVEALDFSHAEAEPTPDQPVAANPPDSSFGFDVDLDDAAHLPVAHSDEPTGDFGVVHLPAESAFTDEEPVAAPAHDAPVEIALNQPVDAPVVDVPTVDAPTVDEPVAEQATAEIAAADLPSVLEYVEETPAPPPAPAPPSEELLDLELDVPEPPAAVPEPAFDAFELTTDTVPEFVAEPVEAVEPPPPVRRASLESFDPIREMPTPIAPTAAAPELTPPEALPAFVSEVPAEPPAPAEAFATETMAELYVQQGLRQEAIGVYRTLIGARPDDAALRARLAELLGDTRRSGGSTARAFFANLAGRRATPLRTSVVIDEPVPVAATPAFVAVVEPLGDHVPDATNAPPPASAVTTGGTLDALFGHSTVATPDNSAAQALAAAFASTPAPPPGRPTRAANDELSLDRVFREGSSTPPKGALAVPRQSTSLRFDQFFTPPADAPSDAQSSPPPTTKGGESEQFQSWLTGLKKP